MRIHLTLLALCFTYSAHAAKPSDVYPPLTSELLMRVELCESNNEVCKLGDDNASVGLLQVTEETFYRLGKLARPSLVSKGLLKKKEKLHWLNTGHQLMVAHWAMSNGWGHEWTCYRKVTGVKRPART